METSKLNRATTNPPRKQGKPTQNPTTGLPEAGKTTQNPTGAPAVDKQATKVTKPTQNPTTGMTTVGKLTNKVPNATNPMFKKVVSVSQTKANTDLEDNPLKGTIFDEDSTTKLPGKADPKKGSKRRGVSETNRTGGPKNTKESDQSQKSNKTYEDLEESCKIPPRPKMGVPTLDSNHDVTSIGDSKRKIVSPLKIASPDGDYMTKQRKYCVAGMCLTLLGTCTLAAVTMVALVRTRSAEVKRQIDAYKEKLRVEFMKTDSPIHQPTSYLNLDIQCQTHLGEHPFAACFVHPQPYPDSCVSSTCSRIALRPREKRNEVAFVENRTMPVLEGTICGKQSMCIEGQCKKVPFEWTQHSEWRRDRTKIRKSCLEEDLVEKDFCDAKIHCKVIGQILVKYHSYEQCLSFAGGARCKGDHYMWEPEVCHVCGEEDTPNELTTTYMMQFCEKANYWSEHVAEHEVSHRRCQFACSSHSKSTHFANGLPCHPADNKSSGLHVCWGARCRPEMAFYGLEKGDSSQTKKLGEAMHLRKHMHLFETQALKEFDFSYFMGFTIKDPKAMPFFEYDSQISLLRCQLNCLALSKSGNRKDPHQCQTFFWKFGKCSLFNGYVGHENIKPDLIPNSSTLEDMEWATIGSRLPGRNSSECAYNRWYAVTDSPVPSASYSVTPATSDGLANISGANIYHVGKQCCSACKNTTDCKGTYLKIEDRQTSKGKQTKFATCYIVKEKEVSSRKKRSEF